MIPGLDSNLITKDREKESTERMQRMLSSLDSMTKKELDCEVELNEKRIKRIARGAGIHVTEINNLLVQFK